MVSLPQTRQSWLIITAVAAALAIVWIAASRNPAPPHFEGNELPVAPFAGNRAPEFELISQDGTAVKLSDYAGQPVVLNFWASWCGPCRVETPHFQALSELLAGEVVILGVNQGESAATIDAFAAEFGLSYPLLLDQDRRVNDQYSVVGLPTTLFIDAEGVVREVYPGAINQAALQDRVERLLQDDS